MPLGSHLTCITSWVILSKLFNFLHSFTIHKLSDSTAYLLVLLNLTQNFGLVLPFKMFFYMNVGPL